MAIAQPNTQTYTQYDGLAPTVIALTPSPAQALAHIAYIKCPSDDDGLDALISGHTAQRVEERREVIVEHTSKTISILEKFHEALRYRCKMYYDIGEFIDYTNKTVTEVLTPAEIEIVFQRMLNGTENEQIYKIDSDIIGQRIGIIATRLILLSYNAGNNDFSF